MRAWLVAQLRARSATSGARWLNAANRVEAAGVAIRLGLSGGEPEPDEDHLG
jgi:hypothetical protein